MPKLRSSGPASGGLQVLTAALLFVQADGWLQWLAVGLGIAGIAMALIQSRENAGGTQQLVAVLKGINEDQGDLSREVPISRDGDETAEQFNQFVERLRQTLEDLRTQTIRVTLSAAHGRKLAEDAARDATPQESCSETIFSSTEESSAAIDELARRTSAIADINSRNLEIGRESATGLNEATQLITQVSLPEYDRRLRALP
ncbi:hypothetical protein [Marinobacter sp.]|uniref:hypothetical protein n=1 Tax=Marinobacter sp. TaxID=50741 RepID=UPI0035675BDA